MKKIILFVIIFICSLLFSQKKEMIEALKNNEVEKAIEIGNRLLQEEPDSFETNFLFAKAYNAKFDFKNANYYITKADSLSIEDWQKSWVFVEAIQTYYGLGEIKKAQSLYHEAKKSKGTKNSEKSLNQWGLLFGFDNLYNDWKIIETENIIFHFQNTISEKEMKFIANSRQHAFDRINSFFNSKLSKKLDFFVWDLDENFNKFLNRKLGFTRPEFCVSHNRLKQSPGHEIAHNISFWNNRKNIRTNFINEGIGVYFDQNNNDKLKIAKKLYSSNSFSIRDIWKNDININDELLYSVSGAFVEYLIKYDKDKFLLLAGNQTYENAQKVYDGKIDTLINQFTALLKN